MPAQFTSTIKNRTVNAQTKVFNRACKANAQRQSAMDRQARPKKTTPYNSTYPKGGVSCSKDSFVVNGTLVFQIKFCGKSPTLRVAANRV